MRATSGLAGGRDALWSLAGYVERLDILSTCTPASYADRRVRYMLVYAGGYMLFHPPETTAQSRGSVSWAKRSTEFKVASVDECLTAGADEHLSSGSAFHTICSPQVRRLSAPHMHRCSMHTTTFVKVTCTCLPLDVQGLPSHPPDPLQGSSASRASAIDIQQLGEGLLPSMNVA